MKKETGITLIALIITVIVLLILAGTAISIAVNGGDVFEKASAARESWNVAVAEEETKLEEVLNVLDLLSEIKQVNDENPGILEGSGTSSDPYTINSIEDLVAFAYNVNAYNAGESGTNYSGKTVVLGLSLDIQNDKSYANPNTKYILGDNGYETNNSGTAIKTLLTDMAGEGFVPVGKTATNSGLTERICRNI